MWVVAYCPFSDHSWYGSPILTIDSHFQHQASPLALPLLIEFTMPWIEGACLIAAMPHAAHAAAGIAHGVAHSVVSGGQWVAANPQEVGRIATSWASHSAAWQIGGLAVDNDSPELGAAVGAVSLGLGDPLVALNALGGGIASVIFPHVQPHLPDTWQLWTCGTIRLSPEQLLAWVGYDEQPTKCWQKADLEKALAEALKICGCDLVAFEPCTCDVAPREAVSRLIGRAVVSSALCNPAFDAARAGSRTGSPPRKSPKVSPPGSPSASFSEEAVQWCTQEAARRGGFACACMRLRLPQPPLSSSPLPLPAAVVVFVFPASRRCHLLQRQ